MGLCIAQIIIVMIILVIEAAHVSYCHETQLRRQIGTWLEDLNPCGVSWVAMCQGRCHLLGAGVLSGSSLPRDSKITTGQLCP